MTDRAIQKLKLNKCLVISNKQIIEASMKKQYVKRVCWFVIAFICTTPVVYGDQLLQVSITSNVQLVPEDEPVSGLRLNLPYGKNTSMTGLDFGFVTESTQDADALQIAVIGNLVEQNVAGMQIASFNVVGNIMKGVQIGFLFNTDNKFSGIGIAGGFNHYKEEGSGILISACGNYGEVLNGAQIGLCNIATYSTGLQIGVVNYTKNARGLQIGVVNVIEEGSLPFMPFLNFNF
jgi:hypothetical protein